MFGKWSFLMALLIISISTIEISNAQTRMYMKTKEGVEGMEKRNRQQGSNNDDFEKFFLKASKSVPRIGRRRIEDQQRTTDIKLPLWAELSDLYEYNPELFASQQLLARWLEYYNSQLSHENTQVPDDDLDGGWPAKMRFKRDQAQSAESALSNELYKYRSQG